MQHAGCKWMCSDGFLNNLRGGGHEKAPHEAGRQRVGCMDGGVSRLSNLEGNPPR